MEGSAWGISAYCGSNIFDRACESCEERLMPIDSVKMSVKVNEGLNSTLGDLRSTLKNISLSLSEKSAETSEVVAQSASRLMNLPTLLSRYEIQPL